MEQNTSNNSQNTSKNEEYETLEFHAWGLDVIGVQHEIIKCLVTKAEIKILDMRQILIDQFCFIYLQISLKPESFASIKYLLEASGHLIGFEVDFKSNKNPELTSSLSDSDQREDGEVIALHILHTSKEISPSLLNQIFNILNKEDAFIIGISFEDIQRDTHKFYQNIEIKLTFPLLKQNKNVAVIWDLDWIKKLYREIKYICWNNNAEVVMMRDNLSYLPRDKTLIVMGLNETVIQQEMIDEMLIYKGLDPQSFNIYDSTHDNFQHKLSQLKGQNIDFLPHVLDRLKLTEGAELVCKIFKKIGYKLALITQGFDFASTHFGKKLGFDYILSNHLEIENGKLTGGIIGENVGISTAHMMDPLRKLDWLYLLTEKEKIKRQNVIMIGDYMHATYLNQACGFRIFFNASLHIDLRLVLYLMGFKRNEIIQFEHKLFGNFNPEPPMPPQNNNIDESDLLTHKATVFIYGKYYRSLIYDVIDTLNRWPFKYTSFQQVHLKSQFILATTIEWPISNPEDESMTYDIYKFVDFWRQNFPPYLKIRFILPKSTHKNIYETQENGYNYCLTLMQTPEINLKFLNTVLKILFTENININTTLRLSDEKFNALQFSIRLPPLFERTEQLKRELLKISSEFRADMALQKDDIIRYCRRLVVFDMDSTLIQQEVIDELAKCVGKEMEIKEITHRAMNGQLDFTHSLIERVKQLKGVPHELAFEAVENSLRLTPGADKLCRILHRLGYHMAVVSGGFTHFVKAVQNWLKLDHAFANILDIDKDGYLTGDVIGPIVSPQRKAALLIMLADVYQCSVEQVIAIGDGANDIPMLMQAGLSIAFCAKAKVKESADLQINTSDLSNILYILGITSEAISRLDQDTHIYT